MTYAAQSRRPNPAAMIGAIGIPAGFAVLLVTGLAVTAVIKQDDAIEGTIINTPPPPKPIPPEPQQVETKPTEQNRSVITAPENPFDLDAPPAPPDNPLPPPPPSPPGPTPGSGNGAGAGSGPVTPPSPPPPPPKLLDPIAAAPRGNPGGWITTRDYRSAWIRREMTGTASFNLQISASGRVTGCSITNSTGHSALDEATCSLLQKRARFEPARDNQGNKVAGTYRSSVTWRLPE